MPPTAWALVSMWSAAWDAPRFRSHEMELKREALAPLLQIAASCVAALLPYVSVGDAKSRLPPDGASRQLLVAALDGEEAGAPLARPSDDPEGFVRALAKASFMTGDNDFSEGLSSYRLDELLSQHCAGQLAQASLLVKDPTGTLLAALDAANVRIRDVLAAPLQAGDLAAVAGRLLLAQRLEHLAEEAGQLLAEPGRQQDEVLEDVEDAMDCEAASADDGDEGARGKRTEDQHTLQRTKTVFSGGSNPDAGEASLANASDPPNPSELSRTKSQIAASVKVQKVKMNVDERREPVHELRRAVSQLSRRSSLPDGELRALQLELEAVDQARKRARDFGEDLVEDMLALDSLHNLEPEDRSTRKAAIVGIEALLADVDAAKARLNSLHQSLQAKLDAARSANEEKKQTGEMPAAAPVTSFGEGSAKMGQSQKRTYTDARSVTVPPPTREDWQRVRLPLRFHSREETDHYAILATVPGLDTEELGLELSEDGRVLTVRGLRVPTASETERMQQKITSKLHSLAKRAPGRLAALGGSEVGETARRAYVELGQDKYGRFSEAFRVPEDVEVGGIDASYRDGVLRVVLPKLPAAPSQLLHGDGRAGRFASGRRGFPGGYPVSAQLPPHRTPLFGGFDDNYLWG